MQQALFKCKTPRWELERSPTFLAIKRCQQTKIGKVIKLARSSLTGIPLLGFRREQQLLLCRIATEGIVRKVQLPEHNTPHKHHHHGGAVCPYYGAVSVDHSHPTWVTASEGVG